MNKDEALRLAWEALEDIGDEWGFTSQRTVPKRKEAITAIKEALANEALEKMAENARELGLDYEPEQDVGVTRYADISVGKIIHNSPSTQRTWVGLTGEELEASKPFRSNDAVVWELAVEWAEAKLKEKNA